MDNLRAQKNRGTDASTNIAFVSSGIAQKNLVKLTFGLLFTIFMFYNPKKKELSLIIAKREGSRIYIVGDTKLTMLPIDLHPNQKIASPENGVLKIIIINPHICICLAGDLNDVDKLIWLCRGIKFDLLRIINELFSFHNSCGGKTEFIVAVSLHPLYKIYEIKNLQKSETVSSWIGSQNGFNEFQKYCLSSRTESPNMDIEYHIRQSLNKVIESAIEPSVSGFVIGAGNSNKYFTYDTRLDINIVPQTLGPGFSVIGHGTPQQGGYSIHYFPSNSTYTVLPVYILQGKFGIIYKSLEGGLLWPEIISGIDAIEFSKIIATRYGIVTSISTPLL